MKTTIEIPDSLFRRAKVKAASRGQTFNQLVIEALYDKLAESDAGNELNRIDLGIAEGERALEEGRVVSHAEAKKRLARWLK